MAQPAGFTAQVNRTDTVFPVLWTSVSSDPPGPILPAVTVKENVKPEILLEDLKSH